MCTLALFRDVSRRYPLVIAANRDEYLDRPTRGPGPLEALPGVMAGLDLRAGGTWLGYRVEAPFFAAGVLNRRLAAPRPPRATPPVSRGRLCLEALGCGSVAEALDCLAGRCFEEFDPFNLFLVDRERAVVVDNHDGVERTELDTGLSVLTNLAVNDPRCPRVATAHAGFGGLLPLLRDDAVGVRELVAAFAGVLGDHVRSADPERNDPFARVCVHAGPYGTRSATIVLVAFDGAVRVFHADDAPCRRAFEEVDCRA